MIFHPIFIFFSDMVQALCSCANDTAPVVRRQITESLVDLGRKQPNLVITSCLDFLKRNMKVCTVITTSAPSASLVAMMSHRVSPFASPHLQTTNQPRNTVQCDQKHRITLLQITERVLSLRRELVNNSIAEPMVDLCMSDMTREKVLSSSSRPPPPPPLWCERDEQPSDEPTPQEIMADWQGAASAVLVAAGMQWPELVMEQLLVRFLPGSIPHYYVMKTIGDFTAANRNAMLPPHLCV